jgi:CxxC motif-containing protein (DUF1111 family)
MNRRAKLIALSLFVISLVCVFSSELAWTQEEPEFGEPLAGLSFRDTVKFLEGLEEFAEREEADEGLGPTFNAESCADCHGVPAVGGSGTANEVRAARIDADGTYHDLPGGSLFQIFAIPSDCQEVIPADANIIAFRQTQALFGAGLIEAIPDEAIAAKADPNDANNDGISGRVHRVLDVPSNQMRVGKFGWKAQQATLLGFSADAYLNEMGITTNFAPNDNAPNGDEAKLALCDEVDDPEDEIGPDGRQAIDRFADFMRFLAAPPRGAITPEVTRGEAVFNTIGCADCHTPSFQTGPNQIAALDRKEVRAFSDFLLHDVGTGDGIVQGGAATNELKTQPLWGLRVSRPFLHDGSAATIAEAIRRHGGEAARVTARFLGLSAEQRADLLAFLNSL